MIRRRPLSQRAPARHSSLSSLVIAFCAVVILAAVVYGVLVPAHGLAFGALMLLALVVIGCARR